MHRARDRIAKDLLLRDPDDEDVLPPRERVVRPILVVDDQERLAKALAAILSGDGYRVIIAVSGQAALEQAHADCPGLVLCDMTMTGMSGLEVFKALRADPATSHLPFVLMSGSEPELKGLRPDAFLHKPFKSAEVLRKIAELTRLAAVAK